MAISNELILETIDSIAAIEGIVMDPDHLVDDIVLVAYEFDEVELFKKAIAQIVHSLGLIIRKRTIGQPLFGNLADWYSFHFKSQRLNKHPADLRIVYKDGGIIIEVHGFGHRHLPSDLYKRLYPR